MSSRRQRSIQLGGRYRQVSLYCNTIWSDKAGGGHWLHLWLSYRNDKQRHSQWPRNSYHNLQLLINPLVSQFYLRNQRPPPSHRPLPKLSLRLLGQQPVITGRPWNPNFCLIVLPLSDHSVANIATGNATIINIQINLLKIHLICYDYRIWNID